MKDSYHYSLLAILMVTACGKVAGEAGETGPAGEMGNPGAQGVTGPKGDQGEPGPFPTGNAPSGITQRGAFRAGGAGPIAAIAQNSVSFTFPLSADPIPHFIPQGGVAPAECPGTLAQPEAEPGHLCLYERFHSVSVGTSQAVNNPINNTSGQASRFGFGFAIQTDAAGNFASVGTWAVTAL
jgi:hypothetical protein